MTRALGAALAVALAAGCASKPKPLDIAIVGTRADDHWRQIERGARVTAEKGRLTLDSYAPARPDPRAQATAIEGYLKRGVRSIAFAASDPKVLAPVIQKATARGVPCITLDSDAPGSGRLAFVTAGDREMGATAARALVELSTTNTGTRGQALVVADSPASPEVQQRLDGFTEIMSAEPGIPVLATIEQGGLEALRAAAASAIMQYPSLSVFFAADSTSAVACAAAVEQSGRAGQIKIVCIGDTPEVMRALRRGVITAAVAPRLYEVGKQAVSLLWAILGKGQEIALRRVPADGVLEVGSDLVTAGYLGERRAEFERHGLPVDF